MSNPSQLCLCDLLGCPIQGAQMVPHLIVPTVEGVLNPR